MSLFFVLDLLFAFILLGVLDVEAEHSGWLLTNAHTSRHAHKRSSMHQLLLGEAPLSKH